MSKVAFISDMHSNLPALKAVIKDIKSRGITQIYCLGDIVGYHTFPNEVVQIIRNENITSIMGNHDEAIVNRSFSRELDKDFPPVWNFDRLTSDNKRFLKYLPCELQLSIDDYSLHLVHGSPESIAEYIRDNSNEQKKYLEQQSCDILICAHTHIPYIKEVNNKYIMNTGSVGKPKTGSPDSNYLTIDFRSNGIEANIISVPYNIAEITSSLKLNNFPSKLIKALESGLS